MLLLFNQKGCILKWVIHNLYDSITKEFVVLLEKIPFSEIKHLKNWVVNLFTSLWVKTITCRDFNMNHFLSTFWHFVFCLWSFVFWSKFNLFLQIYNSFSYFTESCLLLFSKSFFISFLGLQKLFLLAAELLQLLLQLLFGLL